MKKIILSLAIVGFFVQAQAQKLMIKDVPAAVSAAFNKAHPSIKDVDWSKGENNYEAEYDADKVGTSVTYDVSGKLIETEVTIVISALPASAMEYVKKNYKGNTVKDYKADEVKEASKITDANGIITYKAEIKGMDLIFDSEGNFIKSVKN